MMKIGIIGTGTIAPAYMRGLALFEDDIQIVACADLNMERAQTFATEHNLRALSVDDLLADNEVEIVINLTIPIAHAEVALKTIAAGKHAYKHGDTADKGNISVMLFAPARPIHKTDERRQRSQCEHRENCRAQRECYCSKYVNVWHRSLSFDLSLTG